jgi:hypothetical protein
LIEKLSNAPIAAIALTNFRDNISIEKIGHEPYRTSNRSSSSK